MFSPFLDHFTDFYTFLSRFSPKQTGNSGLSNTGGGSGGGGVFEVVGGAG